MARIDTGASGSAPGIPGFEISESGTYALETGLLLKERHGGEVIALCAGPIGAHHTRSSGEESGPGD
jgi:electron transfer flavoprotein beta subunit